MITTAELEEHRADAEEAMVDTCRITRPGEGTGPFNQETGEYDPPEPIEVYGPATAPRFGKCKLKVTNVATQNAGAGEQQVVIQRTELHLPVVGSEDVRVNQTATMVRCIHDAAAEGRVFGIRGLHHESWATARRLDVEEPTG